MIHAQGGGTGVSGEGIAKNERRWQIAEVSVFLFLIIPSLLFSLLVISQGGLGFVVAASSTILRDLVLVSLIIFFLWRNREPLRSIGWYAGSGWTEALIGVLLFFPIFLGAGALDQLLHSLGFSAPAMPLPSSLTASGSMEFVLAFFLVVIVAVAEETIFRGYLMLRFTQILDNRIATVLLSSTIFALGHGYEGSAGVLTVGVVGLAFAIVYLWRGSLIAPIVIHFLQDFLGIVLLPLIGAR